MKFTQFLVLTVFAVLSQMASANTTTCMDTELDFTFYHRTSNGGAPLDYKKIAYGRFSAETSSSRDTQIVANRSDRHILSERPFANNGTEVIYTAKAEGHFQSEGNNVTFQEVEVICVDRLYPICHECP